MLDFCRAIQVIQLIVLQSDISIQQCISYININQNCVMCFPLTAWRGKSSVFTILSCCRCSLWASTSSATHQIRVRSLKSGSMATTCSSLTWAAKKLFFFGTEATPAFPKSWEKDAKMVKKCQKIWSSNNKLPVPPALSEFTPLMLVCNCLPTSFFAVPAASVKSRRKRNFKSAIMWSNLFISWSQPGPWWDESESPKNNMGDVKPTTGNPMTRRWRKFPGETDSKERLLEQATSFLWRSLSLPLSIYYSLPKLWIFQCKGSIDRSIYKKKNMKYIEI